MDKLDKVAADAERARLEHAAAHDAVRGFLATFGLSSGARLDGLVASTVTRAARRQRLRGDRALSTVALEEAEADLTAWSFYILGEERIGDHPPILLARAAYQACGGPERWPDAILNYDLPAEFVREMREAMPDPTPPERPGRMVEQPLETWASARIGRPWLIERLIAAFALDHRS